MEKMIQIKTIRRCYECPFLKTVPHPLYELFNFKENDGIRYVYCAYSESSSFIFWDTLDKIKEQKHISSFCYNRKELNIISWKRR